jgi:hypothetical protein
MMVVVANTASVAPLQALEGQTFYNLEDCVYTNQGSGTMDIASVSTSNNDYMIVNTDGSANFYANNGTNPASQVAGADSSSVTAALQTGGTGLAVTNDGIAYPSTSGTVGTAAWHAYSVPKASGGTRYIIVQQLTPTGGSTSNPNKGVVSVWATQ